MNRLQSDLIFFLKKGKYFDENPLALAVSQQFISFIFFLHGQC